MRKLASTVIALCLVLSGLLVLTGQMAEAAGRPVVTIRASTAAVPSGLRASLRIAVKGGVAGQTLTVQRRLGGTSRWAVVRSLKLPSSLTVSVAQVPKLGTNYFRANLAATGSTPSAVSNRITVTGTVLSSPRPAVAGQRVRFSGYLPTTFNRPLQLQKKRGAKWTRIAASRTARAGRASLAAKISARATFRIYAPAFRVRGKKRPAFASRPLVVRVLADTDRDGLPNYIERRLGTGSRTRDSDRDGLTDQAEVVLTTNPKKRDSDGDGVRDPVDDLDKDGVNNRIELRDKTKAYNPDSDTDGLSDRAEKARRTNPNRADTDRDGVSDGTEVKLGSNPLRADTDRDGKADGKETYRRQVKGPRGATFQASGSAAAVLSARLSPVTDTALRSVAGGLGAAVEVSSEAPLASGSLTIPFNASSLPANARIGVLHFDEGTGTFDLPAHQTVDLAAGRVTVRTTKFSPFVVVDLNSFEAIWKTAIVEPRDGTGASRNIDAVLALDSSGSMADNDPSDNRKVAAKLFVDSLVPGDLASAIDFDDAIRQIQSLTPNFAAVKAVIDSIDSVGGTDISAAVREGLDELDRHGVTAHGRVLVLLTDGQDNFGFDNSLIQRAVDSKTTVYTVGLGSGVDEALLQRIADTTGGKFFLVQDASNLPGAYDRITDDIGAADTDKDGLSDEAERSGWRIQRGSIFKTDPSNADTDGDGVTDGQEAGALTTSSWGKAYEGVSDPTKADTDGDALDDATEIEAGFDAWSSDSDDDRLNDFREVQFGSDPLSVNADGDSFDDAEEENNGSDPNVYDLTRVDGGAAFIAGAVFGDAEWGAKHIARLNQEQISSWQYLTGAVASGFVAIGDVRDAAANLLKLDVAATLISIIGIIPALGDATKISDSAIAFVKRGPKATQAALRVIANTPRLSDGVRVSLIRKIIRLNPQRARLSQDLAVRGAPAPAILRTSGRSIGTKTQDAAAQARILELRRLGATDIRLNQQQVGIDGTKLGINRPDVQYTLDMKRHYIEWDTPDSGRGPGHRVRLLTNDPDGEVELIILD